MKILLVYTMYIHVLRAICEGWCGREKKIDVT